MIRGFYQNTQFPQRKFFSSDLMMGTVRKLTSSIFVAEVGEPPDVAEPNGDGDAREKEVEFVSPFAPGRRGSVVHFSFKTFTFLKPLRTWPGRPRRPRRGSQESFHSP